MQYKFPITLLLICLLFSKTSFGEVNSTLFLPVLYPADANERLVNKEINELAQDSDGFIWLGTRRGLFRYDGYEYKKIQFSDEAFDFDKIYVRSLLAHGDNLWVGTMSSGMFHLDLNTYQITQYHHDKENLTSIGSNQVNDFAIDSNNQLWIANSAGLDKFDAHQQTFTHHQSSDNPDDYYTNYLLDIEFDTDHNLWLSSGKGLAIFDTNSHSFSKILQTKTDDNGVSLKNVIVRKIHVAADNRIWLATQKKGSFIVEPNKDKVPKNYKVIQLAVDPQQSKKINTSIAQPTKDEIWISGFTGIEVRNAHSGELIKTIKSNLEDKYSLNNSVVLSMLVSRSGLLWLASRDFGLYYFNHHNSGFKRINKFIPALKNTVSNYIKHAINLSNQEVLILSQQHLIRINLLSGDIQQLDSPQLKSLGIITSVVKLDSDSVLLGTIDGQLFSYNLAEDSVKKIPITLNQESNEKITYIEKSKTGVWIAQTNTLYHLDLTTLQLDSALSHDGNQFVLYIKSLTVDSSNQLWIGTNVGFGVIKPDALTVKMYTNKVGTQGTLSHNRIHQILEDNSGNIFINTRSGINKLVKNVDDELLFEPFAEQVSAKIHKDEILFSNHDATFWLGPKYHLDKNGKILAEYGLADGLVKSQRGRVILPVDNNKLFYASSELLIISPENINQWQFTPPLAVSNLSISDNSLSSGNAEAGIYLTSSDDSFTVRFSALDFSQPLNNRYRYKLAGYDQKWIETPSDIRQAKYTSLPPGDYTLLLDGTNRTGVWAKSPLAIPVKVDPKFFQTIWFKTLIIALFFILAYSLFKWRITVVKAKIQQELDTEAAIEKAAMMADLVEQKNQLLADVSHELRTPLTVLQLKVEALQHNLVKDVDASYDSLMTKIGDINKLITDIYQLAQSDIGALQLDFSSTPCGTTLYSWSSELDEIVSAKGFEWHQDIKMPENIDAHFDKDKIKQVIFNLVDNSIAYTDAPGIIAFSAKISENNLNITIEDSSPGVDEKNMTKIFERLFRVESSRSRATGGSGLGLAICKSIIEAHHGTISSSDSQYGGLAISITLPIKAS